MLPSSSTLKLDSHRSAAYDIFISVHVHRDRNVVMLRATSLEDESDSSGLGGFGKKSLLLTHQLQSNDVSRRFQF